MVKQINHEELEQLRSELLFDSQLNRNFLFLTVSACIIATLGLLVNSTAVIIGAMIVAPLMMPLRGLALGALDADFVLLKQSLVTLVVGTLVSVLISGVVGGLFGLPASSFNGEILARTQPNLADLGVALAAGAVSGFAKIRREISDAVAGTAISVALMPPLCVVGIALSQGDFGAGGGAFLLYLTNFFGITLACLCVFIMGGYALNQEQMRRALLWFVSLTGLLVIPLFLSLLNLIQRERLEGVIRDSLRRQTITFGRQTELVGMRTEWSLLGSDKPSQLTLIVRTIRGEEPITPAQVRAVQDFLQRKLGKNFRIRVLVSQWVEVTGDESPAEQPSPSAPSLPAMEAPGSTGFP